MCVCDVWKTPSAVTLALDTDNNSLTDAKTDRVTMKYIFIYTSFDYFFLFSSRWPSIESFKLILSIVNVKHELESQFKH